MVLKLDSPWLRALVHGLCAVPALWLAYDTFGARLGPDPVAEITDRTGQWALRMLLLCLAMTPLRHWLGQPWPLKYRRMLGLYAFCYACLHLATYVVLDLGGYWVQIGDDILKRPYITVGFIAWSLLLPLAATSTRGMMRRLGRRWGQLHRAIYVIGVLAVLHFTWQVKADLREPLIYAGILALLLGVRLWWRWRRPAQPRRGA